MIYYVPSLTNSSLDNVSKKIFQSYLIPNNINNILDDILTWGQMLLTIVLAFSFLTLLPALFLTEFKISFARVCCKVALKKEDELERAKYILLSLNWYNYYLRNSLDLQLNEKDKLFDNIIMKINENSYIIQDIDYALNKNKLELLKLLKLLSENIYSNDKEKTKEYLLTEFTYADKIRGLSNLIIPLITVAISVISLVLK